MSSSSHGPLSAEGPGSVSGAPDLPAGFADTFTSRYVDTGGLRLHAVIGGDGPPLLLVHGWPETWYAWRLVMPALARDFQVIAVDQRGIGLSDKPAGRVRHRHPRRRPGRADGRARPRAVRRGRPRHRVRDRLRAGRRPPGAGRPRGARRDPRLPGGDRLAAACSSPSSSTTGSGTSPSTGSRGCPSSSITGREDVFFGYEFAVQGGQAARRRDRLLRRHAAPTPTSLRGSLGFYRALDATLAQNARAHEPSGCRCPSWRSAERRATASTSGRRWKPLARRRAERGHPRRRPLGRRAGSRRAAGRADRVPGPLPGCGRGSAGERAAGRHHRLSDARAAHRGPCAARVPGMQHRSGRTPTWRCVRAVLRVRHRRRRRRCATGRARRGALEVHGSLRRPAARTGPDALARRHGAHRQRPRPRRRRSRRGPAVRLRRALRARRALLGRHGHALVRRARRDDVGPARRVAGDGEHDRDRTLAGTRRATRTSSRPSGTR